MADDLDKVDLEILTLLARDGREGRAEPVRVLAPLSVFPPSAASP